MPLFREAPPPPFSPFHNRLSFEKEAMLALRFAHFAGSRCITRAYFSTSLRILQGRKRGQGGGGG
jgi:hypothetical protein